jgi:tRNA/rRNA methyltransferase
MPGAGTDRTKTWVDAAGPVIILVEPQLGENIGMAARAMGNFGLRELRLVNPRVAWPNPQAHALSAGADRILEQARLYEDVAAAIADCTFVFATTARAHDQAKPVVGADEAARLMASPLAAGQRVGVLFGRERYGLESAEVALADHTITLPVNPAFASLNLGQAVLVIAYEWYKLVSGGELPFTMPQRSAPAPKQQLDAFLAGIERELDKIEFFRPPEKRPTMLVNLRNIFHRMQPTQQDIQTLHGIILSIAEGRKGPARGGILDSEEAARLRTLLAEHQQGRVPSERGPVRGLARLLRRNPTDAERVLWDALVKDRRFAGKGFKRQVPIGPHIVDFVSFPLRAVIDLVPADESAQAGKARTDRHAWLHARDYRVVDVRTQDVETNIAAVLDDLVARMELGA